MAEIINKLKTKKIFIAFTGPKIDQRNKFCKIADNYECWNLNKLRFEQFINYIKKEIPPVNKNVLRNYKIKEISKTTINFGITEKQYEKCSWGLLLPDNVLGTSINGYDEIIFLINLYSPHFLYPVFYIAGLGIKRLQYEKDFYIYYQQQNRSKIFKTKKFVKFFEKLLPQSVYGIWQADRCKKWEEEDWQLFIACLLFSDLKKYENEKDPFTWRREFVDMTTIIETLFTTENEKQEITYRIKKRIAVLAGFAFENIEEDIRKLYGQRSSFVHGSFFKEIYKEIKNKEAKNKDNIAELPLPDFELSYKHKERVRFLLVFYLNLAKILKTNKKYFGDYKNVIEPLEESIINVNLRKKVESCTEEIFALMAKPTFIN